jgi:hypothetical protein
MITKIFNFVINKLFVFFLTSKHTQQFRDVDHEEHVGDWNE